MDRDAIREKVIGAIQQIQEASGRASGAIHPQTKPIEDVEGFDSMSGLEATIALSGSLGCEIRDNNLFVSGDGRRALSIAEVVDKLSKTMNGKMAAL